MKNLAATIKAQGILEPLRVIPKGNKFEVLFGERRRRAAELAGLKKVPVIVHGKPLKEGEVLEMRLVENLQREDLSVMEKAKAYRRLMEMGKTGKEIAERIGTSDKTVSEFVALLRLSEKVQAKVLGFDSRVADDACYGGCAHASTYHQPVLLNPLRNFFPPGFGCWGHGFWLGCALSRIALPPFP